MKIQFNTDVHIQRCMLEARLKGRQPVAVTDHAATLERAAWRGPEAGASAGQRA